MAQHLRLTFALGLTFLGCAGCGPEAPVEAPPPAGNGRWVGSSACKSCHEAAYAAWRDSPHHLAMLPATREAPLRASPDPSSPLVEGADGLRMRGAALGLDHDVPLVFALGRQRVEQYLGTLAPGRIQALPLAFDVQRREWFDLFAREPRSAEDWGHWTNRGMTANAQCLFCHTTGYDKGYRPATDTYESRWVEMGVGCEACHGPGRDHVAARYAGRPDRYGRFDGDTTDAVCGSCHSRRVERAAWTPGTPFTDAFEPELLDTQAHYPDGQIRDEVYELVAFQTSVMHREGVRCTSCHGDTKQALPAGNAVCRSCHEAGYEAPSHTRHPVGSAGATCTGCHMPVTVFMERDPRHDHSFQRPDPELTVALGVPNACNRCHTERDAAWAAALVREWYPDDRVRAERRRWAVAIARGREADPATVPDLLALVGGRSDPVRRASAARLLAAFPTTSGVTTTLVGALDDPEPLVRAGAAWALAQRSALSPEVRAGLLRRLGDASRVVRLHAVLGLRELDLANVPPGTRQAFTTAAEEWRQSQELAADTPEARYNLAIFRAARGDLESAAAEYRSALRLWPDSIQARHNLAMLLAQQGRLEEAVTEFRALLARAPVPVTSFALGLTLGQLGRWAEAARALEQCLAEDPAYPRARYNLALALVKAGQTSRALDELERATGDPAARRDAILTLVDLARQVGDRARLERWVLEAARLDPEVAETPGLTELLDR